jgi:hypothetical protein
MRPLENRPKNPAGPFHVILSIGVASSSLRRLGEESR